jgi:hypothetical protein
VEQQLIDTDTHLLELVEVRRRVGVADDRETAQADAVLKLAKSTMPSLRVALEAQLNRLDVLMGAQPGTYAEELSKPGTIPGIPAIGGADQPLDVLRRRPDIIAAEQLRHCDTKTTLQKYGHVVGDSQRRAVNSLAEKIERHAIELESSAELESSPA